MEKNGRTNVNEEYLAKVFNLVKKMEVGQFTKIRARFNHSEMRMLGEVLRAEYEGKRVISTQLATRLGVTRSAISQMVNKLEARGVIKRVADEVDRKIAYIELSEEAKKAYEEEYDVCCELVGKLIKKMGKEKLDTMLELGAEFNAAVAEIRK